MGCSEAFVNILLFSQIVEEHKKNDRQKLMKQVISIETITMITGTVMITIQVSIKYRYTIWGKIYNISK